MARKLAERCRAIAMLVLDVDGVLTRGDIVHGDGGLELKAFHVRDGTGLRIWAQTGKRTALLTGRGSQAVLTRAAELGIDHVVQRATDKTGAFESILKEQGVAAEQVCFVGDDLPDLEPMARSGLAVSVADGCAEAMRAAQYVTRARGGEGAVREVIELILGCQGAWPRRAGPRDGAKG